jgi:hypothetical protein
MRCALRVLRVFTTEDTELHRRLGTLVVVTFVIGERSLRIAGSGSGS